MINRNSSAGKSLNMDCKEILKCGCRIYDDPSLSKRCDLHLNPPKIYIVIKCNVEKNCRIRKVFISKESAIKFSMNSVNDCLYIIQTWEYYDDYSGCLEVEYFNIKCKDLDKEFI